MIGIIRTDDRTSLEVRRLRGSHERCSALWVVHKMAAEEYGPNGEPSRTRHEWLEFQHDGCIVEAWVGTACCSRIDVPVARPGAPGGKLEVTQRR